MCPLLLVAAFLVPSSPVAAEPAAPQRQSPATAFWLSVGTSVAGLGLVLTGADIGIRRDAYPRASWLEPTVVVAGAAALLVGPSLGRLYGGGRLWNPGLAWRLIGLGVASGGLAAALAVRGYVSRPGGGGSGGAVAGPILVGAPIVGLGAIAFLAGASWEIATTRGAVERANRARGFETTLQVTPISTRAGLVPSLALAGQF